MKKTFTAPVLTSARTLADITLGTPGISGRPTG